MDYNNVVLSEIPSFSTQDQVPRALIFDKDMGEGFERLLTGHFPILKKVRFKFDRFTAWDREGNPTEFRYVFKGIN